MKETGKLSQELDEELEPYQNIGILAPGYKKKKLIQWTIRNIIAFLCYYFFWEYEWIRLSLWVYVPLTVFTLIYIYLVIYILKRKIAKTKTTIDNLDTTLAEIEKNEKNGTH